ncbi:MAG: cyclic nucleotide-binding domain-containing protein [Nitrospinae bacterium]|nr:cyclic nucleotide-binding domain-containing protein [Nitrospinota bacterium]
MDTLQNIKYFDELEIFKNFTNQEKSEIASFTQNFVSCRKGDLILQQESNDPSLYIILDGQVVLKKNEQKDVEIATLLPGSIFGTIPSLPVTPRNKNVIALSNSLVLRIDRPILKTLSPTIINKFNFEFINILFRRVAEMNVRISRERSEVRNIARNYGIIKSELDKSPALPKEIRIASNLLYEQLKNFQNPTK